jgi:hypothetical protein
MFQPESPSGIIFLPLVTVSLKIFYPMSVANEHPNPGEQGRAAHSTGSTTQGGSNYGQGSSHLGGESYQQGHTSNSGTNYGNETDKLGSSSTGTNNEGSSSPVAGADNREQHADTNTSTHETRSAGWNGNEERNDLRRDEPESKDTKKLFEGDRRDTSLEQSTGMSSNADADASKSRAWSESTNNGDQ